MLLEAGCSQDRRDSGAVRLGRRILRARPESIDLSLAKSLGSSNSINVAQGDDGLGSGH